MKRYTYGMVYTESSDDLAIAIREETGNLLADLTMMNGLIRDEEAGRVIVVIIRNDHPTPDEVASRGFGNPTPRVIRLRASGAIDGYDLH